MDPLRAELRTMGAAGGADHDARIEQLLLAGLDEYFAQRYEHAISVWTRVLFFDRQHDRARAYIDRARRAQAERLRETEAVLHEASEAFRAGDIPRSRALAATALDRGASADDVQGVLARLDRFNLIGGLASHQEALGSHRTPVPVASTSGRGASSRPSRAAAWVVAVALALALASAIVAWRTVRGEDSAAASAPAAAVWQADPLPIPEAFEVHLSRARTHLATGRLHDALSQLDRVPFGNSLHAEAERLRAEVQTRLLTLVARDPAPQ